MNEPEYGANLWRMTTEFMVSSDSLHMQPGGADLYVTLQILPPLHELYDRLHAALANTMDRIASTTKGATVIIRVFVATKDILRDNGHALPTQARQPCWGFFLVEKRTHHPGILTTVLPHLIEVYCYQEGEDGHQEHNNEIGS